LFEPLLLHVPDESALSPSTHPAALEGPLPIICCKGKELRL
jgi:hypothetical protein